MAYWLMKTEPGAWSWDQQVKAAPRARRGPACAITPPSQSDEDEERRPRLLLSFRRRKEIVGIVEIVREHYPDPTAEKGEPWVVVDVKAAEAAAEAGDARGDQGRAEARRTWRW